MTSYDIHVNKFDQHVPPEVWRMLIGQALTPPTTIYLINPIFTH